MKKKTKNKKNNNSELANSKVKFNFKKHLLPPLAGLLVMSAFILVFNSQALFGYFYSTEVRADYVVLNQKVESTDIDKNASPKIIINNVSIKAPIDFTLGDTDETNFQIALRHGVVHYPKTALPGNDGNVVIFGHSSGVWWAKGDYKFVFAPLHEVDIGNKIYVEYDGTRYTYEINNIKKVQPDDISVLSQPANKKKLTLITCTPIGTNQKRLIIEAEQTSPKENPVAQDNQKSNPTPSEVEALPGAPSSLWDSLKDFF